jgi:hypothetical protein
MANLLSFAMVNHIQSEPGNKSKESQSIGSGISPWLYGPISRNDHTGKCRPLLETAGNQVRFENRLRGGRNED